ncbi:uncharacterized protein STEHIDRAFT_166922 [Stereum hirsutum FP-91666 SS1]|uniref:uncharacterized protein n=1 Tax=Stereum hirsutum (strain FP-91666) TaxID=721885 RepID=UPI000440FE7E|nr:uncharacterized protein STEHIDRAFT_166922 [Stereum hirsutum FP-91666 SS1]EIM88978.1 hypothetical protein STEHIDRAFT_166922 [Stereum hirsutum FP-91666 SS1]
MNPDKPPLVFLQVCREWREVALNTPELWAELYLPTPPKTRDAYKSLRSAVRTWLARSSARPLSLYLNTDACRNWFNRHDEAFQDKQATLAPSYLDVLLKHSTRWQRAELFLPNYRTRKSVSLFPFPLLTQLYIALPYEMPEAEDSVLVKSLFSAPHLQDLTLDYAFTQNMVLPWSTLKTLRLIFDRTNAPSRGVDDEDRFELVPAVYVSWFANGLSQASHLVRLDLYLDFYEVYPLEIDIAVTLPRLEYLRITGGGWSQEEELRVPLLRLITAPQLKVLHIPPIDYPFWEPEYTEAVSIFLGHCSSSLRKLNACCMPSSELVAILPSLSALESITIGTYSRPIVEDLVNALTCRPPSFGSSSSGSNSRLRHIAFGDTRSDSNNSRTLDKAVADMLISRLHPASSLSDCTDGDDRCCHPLQKFCWYAMYRRDRFTEYSRLEADRIFAHIGSETSFILDDRSDSEEPLIMRIPSTPPSGDDADSAVEGEVSNDPDFVASISKDQQAGVSVKDVAKDEVSATVEESPYDPIAPTAVEEDGCGKWDFL